MDNFYVFGRALSLVLLGFVYVLAWSCAVDDIDTMFSKIWIWTHIVLFIIGMSVFFFISWTH